MTTPTREEIEAAMRHLAQMGYAEVREGPHGLEARLTPLVRALLDGSPGLFDELVNVLERKPSHDDA